MIKKVPFRFAVNSVLTIGVLVVIFHLLVILGVISYGSVWGGRLETREQMLSFEIVSILITIFLLTVVAMRGNYIPQYLPIKVTRLLLWLFAFLFALNTFGNLFSLSSTETLIATPITLFLTVMFVRLAVEK